MERIILTLCANGADIIELGVPFSDPMADGPTIQASSQRALAQGIALNDILQLVNNVRVHTRTPVVIFSYLNPILQYGVEALARDSADAGIDGLLVVDAVDDEAIEIGITFKPFGIDLISLIAPTTTDLRLAEIVSNATGFIYAISRAGVTGAQSVLGNEAEELVNRARSVTDLPIAVGFGISTRTDIEHVWKFADAAVVGSAIVAEIERSIPAGNTVEIVRDFTRSLLPVFANSSAEI